LARSQARSKRKYTGKKYKHFKKKRKIDLAGPQIITTIGTEKKKRHRVHGGNYKLYLFSTSFCNVSDPITKKTEKLKILRFEENPAAKELSRRHIMTKGTIIQTEKGLAKITSRPGQDGLVNAILIKE
jgi:small subunit ribosomal protein S8e